MTDAASRRAFLAIGLIALSIAGPAMAQQFDSFGEGTLEGFQLGTELPDNVTVPSLNDDGSLPMGPDIDLQITDGQSGVGIITFPGTGTPVTSISQPNTEQGSRITLRALDKTLGRPTDVDMGVGETVVFGRIAIQLIECRYPADDPSSDAYAHLTIFDPEGNELFDGWMVASSPALSALEHPRYDVWVLRCTAE